MQRDVTICGTGNQTGVPAREPSKGVCCFFENDTFALQSYLQWDESPEGVGQAFLKLVQSQHVPVAPVEMPVVSAWRRQKVQTEAENFVVYSVASVLPLPFQASSGKSTQEKDCAILARKPDPKYCRFLVESSRALGCVWAKVGLSARET